VFKIKNIASEINKLMLLAEEKGSALTLINVKGAF
jgi:hypothetical protein